MQTKKNIYTNTKVSGRNTIQKRASVIDNSDGIKGWWERKKERKKGRKKEKKKERKNKGRESRTFIIDVSTNWILWKRSEKVGEICQGKQGWGSKVKLSSWKRWLKLKKWLIF